ncbi:glucosamine inositolphosphorylceramide transferase family protein [Acidimangrovimonas pyrenivorans]|uniref:glucosamine inositolphosphorylceramide transferase family protein n=1 Tax=Acidimangrovimonas pyrenivorans TaxID=2030798 RepID=UPI00366EA0F9
MQHPESTEGIRTAPRVTVILAARRVDCPASRRLLNALVGDPRFVLQQVFTGPESADLSGAPGWALRLERRAVAVPDRAGPPEWKAGRPDPVPLPADAAELAPCDVVLDLSGASPEGLADRATTGLWRLSVDDPADGAASGAVLRGETLLPCALVRLPAAGAEPRLVARAAFQPKLLLGRSLDFAREKSMQMILRELARLALTGAPADLGLAERPPRPPGGGSLPGYAARILGEASGRAARKLRHRLGGAPRPFSLRLGPGQIEDFDPARTVEAPNRNRHYRADPFLFEHDQALYCFFESYSYRDGLGHIAVGRIEDDGLTEIGPALTRPYHLSFPFIFRHAGEIFMMPETHQAGRIEIWRCTDFPTGWTLHATTLDGVGAADPVLLQHGADWWLFANLCNDSIGDLSSELHLFRIDGPDLTWIEPHPLNPVVIGSEVARGGGRVVEIGGRLLRPSQDNSGRSYGRGLNLMEIVALSPTSYEERRIRHLSADFLPGLIGCHHLDAAAGRVVIDVCRR